MIVVALLLLLGLVMGLLLHLHLLCVLLTSSTIHERFVIVR